MIDYNIEIQRDIEYKYFSSNDMFLILVLSDMLFYDSSLNLLRKSELSVNSRTSLVYSLNDCSNEKGIGKIGGMDIKKDIAYREAIEKINSALISNKTVNEKILHTKDAPFLQYEEFKPLKLTRLMKFHWNHVENQRIDSNIYISDNDDNTCSFLFDGSTQINTAVNDDEIITKVYKTFAKGNVVNTIWNKKEIRKIFNYPTIEQMY